MRFYLLLLTAFLAQAQDYAGTYVGELATPNATLRLGLIFQKAPGGGLSGDLVSIDQAYSKLRLSDVSVEGKKLKFRAAAAMASFEGEFSESGHLLTGKFVQGLVFELTFRKVDGLPKPPRPQEPKAPFPYLSEDVAYPSAAEGVQMAGTLTLPKGKGPFAAVVLISGSGPQDRDESLAEHKPFLVLADHLTRAGIAVLRYDDRGTAKSTGVFRGSTTQDFSQDARGALTYLRARKDIDSTKLALLGHSEGGIIAPMVAVNDPKLAAMILLAGPGLSGEKIMEQQLYDTLRAEGVPESQFSMMRKNQVESLDKLRQSDAWLKNFLSYDPVPALKLLRCPVLALIGSRDTQVNAEQNLPAIEKAFTEGGNKRATVKKMLELNHLFQRAKTGGVTEYGKIEETMAPEALAEVTSWLKKTLAIP
jgi:uncharacterized protein